MSEICAHAWNNLSAFAIFGLFLFPKPIWFGIDFEVIGLHGNLDLPHPWLSLLSLNGVLYGRIIFNLEGHKQWPNILCVLNSVSRNVENNSSRFCLEFNMTRGGSMDALKISFWRWVIQQGEVAATDIPMKSIFSSSEPSKYERGKNAKWSASSYHFKFWMFVVRPNC